MKSLSEIEEFNKEWQKTESFKEFAKWYSSIGLYMNITNICHDHLCAGIWRGVEKYLNERDKNLLEQTEIKKIL